MADEKPWLTPAVGDVLFKADGRRETVTAVENDQRRYGHRLEYRYVDSKGAKRVGRPLLATWATHCSAEVRKGGAYRRRES